MKKRVALQACVKCGAPMPPEMRQCRTCKRQYWRDWYAAHRRDPASIAKRRAREQNARHADPRLSMIRNAKQRAKRAGVPFDIALDDIVIPDTCPILGIPLKIAPRTPTDNSPSLDRIFPARGYVRGNVAVISFRANAIKNSASINELLQVALWIEANIP